MNTPESSAYKNVLPCFNPGRECSQFVARLKIAIKISLTQRLAQPSQAEFFILTEIFADKNMRLEREKNSLREKLKSSTSFMSELEDRIKNIEKKENLPNSNNSNSNDSNASS